MALSTAMRLDRQFVSRLDLAASANSVLAGHLDRFPRLMIDRCLESAGSSVVAQTAARYTAGGAVISELLTMPRPDGSPRPINVLSTTARVLYESLVSGLAEALPDSTRAPGSFDQHRAFGLEGSHQYVVELDIAACYEYIVHSILLEELVSRSAQPLASAAVVDLLGEVFPLGRGLPQMLAASDRLADTYLARLDRAVRRDGWELNRYADDIRVLAGDWEAANACVGQVAEHARSLGLTLSSKKSTIMKRTTLRRMQDEDDRFFHDQFHQARSDLTQIVFVGGSLYDEPSDEAEVPPEDSEAWAEAGARILHDWRSAMADSTTDDDVAVPVRNALGIAVLLARSHADRLSDSLLSDIVFHHPVRLEQVCRYVADRAKEHSQEAHWLSLSMLCRTARQTPWEKIWLLHTAEFVGERSGQPPTTEVLMWALAQLRDRHEIVRAQAAWTLALYGRLSPERIPELYAAASAVTGPALAAAAAKVDGIGDQLLSALADDSPLNRQAVRWSRTS